MDLFNFYNQRVSQLNDKEKECISKEQKLPLFRLFIVIIGIASFYFLFKLSIVIAIIVLLVILIVFFITIRIDKQNSDKRKEFQLLKLLNENEIKYLNGIYDFFDDGNRYKSEIHPYSNDLDVFGDYSLFQSINRTTLSKSGDILASWLLFPADRLEIEDRNEAVIELSKNIDWRQKIFIAGYSLKKNDNSLNNLRWVLKIHFFDFF